MKNFLKQIEQGWMIIIFIGTAVFSWALFSARLTAAEGKIEQLSQVITQINEINISLAVIQTDIGYIKSKLK